MSMKTVQFYIEMSTDMLLFYIEMSMNIRCNCFCFTHYACQ